MKKLIISTFIVLSGFTGCQFNQSQEYKDLKIVQRQQSQYAKAQPIPVFRWSLERDLLIKLYKLRNRKVATHTVWRSDYGMIEGDCPSLGYGLPYDTSLTNPLMATDTDQRGNPNNALTSIGQAEPNGVFASTNTSATWVMCTNKHGEIEPVYIESKVTTYPYSVRVDYDKNRVTRIGVKSVKLK